MQGKILDYNKEFKSGLIRGDDGNRYRFSIDDCKSTITPKIGLEVDFVVNGDKAVEIYILNKDTVEKIKDVTSSATEIVSNNFDSIKKIAIKGIIIVAVIMAVAVTKDLMDEVKYKYRKAEYTETKPKPKECKIIAESVNFEGSPGTEGDVFDRLSGLHSPDTRAVRVHAVTDCEQAYVTVRLFSYSGVFITEKSIEISSGVIDTYFRGIDFNTYGSMFSAKYVIEPI